MPRYRAFKGSASVSDATFSESVKTLEDGSRVVELSKVVMQLPPCESMDLKAIADSVDLQANFVDPRYKFKSQLDFSIPETSETSETSDKKEMNNA